MVATFVLESGSCCEWAHASDLAAASSQLPAGAYTTLRTYHGGRVVRLEQHLARLSESSALQGNAADPLDQAAARTLLAHAVSRCEAGELRIRLTWAPPLLFASCEALTLLPAELYLRGVRCSTLPLRRSQPHVKDTRFIETAQGAYARLPAGIHEALMVDDTGAILEGLTSNFFAVRAGVLHPEAERVLLGVTRQLVLDAAAGEIQVVATPVRLADLSLVSECFLTSASRGVLPVVAIDDSKIGNGVPGPLTARLSERFEAIVEREGEPLR